MNIAARSIMPALRRIFVVAVLSAGLVAATAAPGGAITGGQPDGDRHPYVGAILFYFPPLDELVVGCTGTLISTTVFLTAAHCGADGSTRYVSFDEHYVDGTSPLYSGTFYAHPDFDFAQATQNDLAVILLDDPVAGIDPSQLPTLPEAGLLDGMKADGTLNQSTRFTSVGYGILGYDNGPGGQTPLRTQSRNYSSGSYNALNTNRLHLSQNPAHGDGGTCDGDSGGPTFLGAGTGETTVLVGVTSTGETHCKSTNVLYRLDTESARQFLGQYVPLP